MMQRDPVKFWHYFFLAPLFGALGGFIFWALGFTSFVITVLVMNPAPQNIKTDGIVVLTGGADRVRTGLELLQSGTGKELLISGVYHAADLKDLILKAHMNKGDFPCCITLGFKALDTSGNAQETALWAHDHHIKTIRLVTATYHMPRALIEMQRAMPDITLVPHPVRSSGFDPFSKEGALLLTEEYHKSLIVFAKALTTWAQQKIHEKEVRE